MTSVLITFPCSHSKQETKPENGIFLNKAIAKDKFLTKPGKKQRKQRCRIAKYFPHSASLWTKYFLSLKIISCCLKRTN